MVKNYTDQQILDRIKSLPSYDPVRGIPSNTIVEIRSTEDTPNIFDDKMYPYKDGTNWFVTSCTTNPGGPVLKGGWRKYNSKGAAVLKADEIYYDAYRKSDGKTIRHHNGRMPCLRQVKPMKYYRDGNNDGKTDAIGSIEVANNSTNIHFNSYSVFDKIKNSVTSVIGWWSAGCQVLNVEEDYERLYNLYDDKPITLILLNEF
jgi:hypothetical protein